MRWQARWAALAAILFVTGRGAGAQNTGTKVEKQIPQIFEGAATGETPGLAVLVKKNGKVIFERGYGLKELRTHAKIDGKTNFRLASVTKQFTAMAVMLLVHDKKLRYNESLTEIFPDFPAYGKTITVRHLLNHTGGLPDYEDLMEAREKQKGPIWSEKKQIQDEEVLALLEKEARGRFAPGTNWAYSNSGYVVLGLVVAKVSGMQYGDFLHQRIFSPLKMADTLVFQKGKNAVPNRAFGHTKAKDRFEETDQSATSATLGDGGVYSSVEDLAKWDDALGNHTLLSAEEMKPAFTAAKFGDPAQAILPDDAPLAMKNALVSYGFGWFLDPYKGHPRMWHYGESIGFKTAIQRFPNDGLTVIVLCNRADLDPGELAMRVADVLLPGR